MTVEHFVGNNSLKEQGNGAKRLVEGYHGGESIGYLRFRLGRHTGQLSILYASGTGKNSTLHVEFSPKYGSCI